MRGRGEGRERGGRGGRGGRGPRAGKREYDRQDGTGRGCVGCCCCSSAAAQQRGCGDPGSSSSSGSGSRLGWLASSCGWLQLLLQQAAVCTQLGAATPAAAVCAMQLCRRRHGCSCCGGRMCSRSPAPRFMCCLCRLLTHRILFCRLLVGAATRPRSATAAVPTTGARRARSECWLHQQLLLAGCCLRGQPQLLQLLLLGALPAAALPAAAGPASANASTHLSGEQTWQRWQQQALGPRVRVALGAAAHRDGGPIRRLGRQLETVAGHGQPTGASMAQLGCHTGAAVLPRGCSCGSMQPKRGGMPLL